MSIGSQTLSQAKSPATRRSAEGRGILQVLSWFARSYPFKSVLVVLALLVASLVEGVGFISLFPVLEIVVSSQPSGGVEEDANAIRQLVLDVVRSTGLPATVPILLGIMMTAMVLKAGFRFVALSFSGAVVADVAADLRHAIIDSLLKARWTHFQTQPVGNLANSVGIETVKASGTYSQATQLATSMIQTGVFLGLTSLVSPRMTLLAIGFGIAMFILLSAFMRIGREAGTRQSEFFRSISARFSDVFQGIKPLKAMDAQRWLAPIFEHENRALAQAQRRLVLARYGLANIQEPIIFVFIGTYLLLALSVWEETLPTVFMVSLLLYRVVTGMSGLQSAYQVLTMNVPFFWAIRDRTDEARAAREEFSGSRPANFLRAISLRHLRFVYDQDPILDDVSMEIPANRLTTLIGPSGSGKSTIADLLSGLLRPIEGDVYLDDDPLARIDIRTWRQKIGYVPQEMFLFHDTALANVTLGDPSLGRAEAEQALRQAGAWEFVGNLPEGLDTVLGERGTRLSGGQRQRIAIARALARKPKLLILDEATASLDPETEAAIIETLRGLTDKVTILAISHQAIVSDSADRIFEISNRKICRIK